MNLMARWNCPPGTSKWNKAEQEYEQGLKFSDDDSTQLPIDHIHRILTEIQVIPNGTNDTNDTNH